MPSSLAPGYPYRAHHYFQAGPRDRTCMAGSMQTSNDPVAISNPLTRSPSSILSIPSESISLLKAFSQKSESNLSSIASAGLRTSPSPGLEGLRRLSPPTMTTITGMAPVDRRDRPLEQEMDRGSQSGSQVARAALSAAVGIGGDEGVKPQQEQLPTVNAVNEATDIAAKPVRMPSDEMQVEQQTSPTAVPDAFVSGDNIANPTTLMNSSTVASPGPIEESTSQDGDHPHHRDEPEAPGDTNRAFSYPMPAASIGDPRRGFSLPHSGFRGSPRSPSAKKHRCQFCSTEFTRHHNLKSHLLTHSQEKPYVCQTCQSRFRRLHDLKRHTKLHTGERPHICPKCGRRFARGDALARHNKGSGGCAGRRASMGSYAGEDDYGEAVPGGPDDSMEGLMYTEPERMDEDEERRLSMPSIRKHSAPSTQPAARSATIGTYHQTRAVPSTYPPVSGSRPSSGGLLPPATSHGGSSSSTSPVSQTGAVSFPLPGHPSSYPTAAMTESPKPLSPNTSTQLDHGAEANTHLHQKHRAHSPGIGQQYAPTHYGRSGPAPTAGAVPAASRGASTAQAPLGLPPPSQPGAPQLPPPPGLNPSDPRFPLSGQSSSSAISPKHGAAPGHPGNRGPPAPSTKNSAEGGQTTLNNASYFSGHQDANGTSEQNREDRLWTYLTSIQEEVDTLRTEVVALRAQLAAQNPPAGASAVPSQHTPVEGNNVNSGPR